MPDEVSIQYNCNKRPLKRWTKFTITLVLEGWDDKWVYHKQVFTQNDQLCAKGYTKAAFWKNKKAQHMDTVTKQVNTDRLETADSTPEDWLSYGKNYSEDRFSTLNQINKSNIDSLGLAWSIDLGTTRGIEATPIVVDGIMYLTGPWSVVYAIDARKGKIIWTYDPEVPKGFGEKACCDVVNRGVALYQGLVLS